MPASEARSRARAFELLLITTATSAFRRPALQASMTACIVEPSCDAKKPSLIPTPVPWPDNDPVHLPLFPIAEHAHLTSSASPPGTAHSHRGPGASGRRAVCA